MDLTQSIKTDQLLLRSLEESDHSFILELVNTEGWLTFIGDRNVNNETEAVVYIQNILANDDVTYWVVQLAEQKIGIITLIKRAHLPYYDIGFAFLPEFHGKGYAYESSKAVLELIIETSDYETIMATTNPNNHSSIKLIEKLGFSFYKTESNKGKESSLYSLDIGARS